MANENGSCRRQCVWIIRYGLTEYPLVENKGPYDSDIDPEEGVVHAKAIADRVASSGSDAPMAVYASPFLRTTHTANILAKAISEDIKIRIEEGLTEWLTPSLLVEPNGVKTVPLSVDQLQERFPHSIDASYTSVNPVVPDELPAENVPMGSPHFVESESALLSRCKTTMSRILEAISGQSIAIVSHAPCDQAIAIIFEGAKSPADSELGPWALGGITMFSRMISSSGEYGKWNLDLYSDTSHMPGIYKQGIKKWSLPCLSEK